jgi:hypothetical protein
MEIGNKDTQYNVSKKNHTTISQRYKCLLHVKFGNQPYPDYINADIADCYGTNISCSGQHTLTII